MSTIYKNKVYNPGWLLFTHNVINLSYESENSIREWLHYFMELL